MSRNIPTTFWLFLIKWIILITKGFLFRFLAHEIEEENFLIEELVVEWETKQIQNNEEYTPMHRLRYELFVRMDYRALVSRKVCEEVMITKSKLSAIQINIFAVFLDNDILSWPLGLETKETRNALWSISISTL